MSTNNREFDFFALMASLEAHYHFELSQKACNDSVGCFRL